MEPRCSPEKISKVRRKTLSTLSARKHHLLDGILKKIILAQSCKADEFQLQF
jgi:hypothetical protein